MNRLGTVEQRVDLAGAGRLASYAPTRPAYVARTRRRTYGPAMATIFTRIIDGEIPGTFVWRDDRCVVFMSINPMARGHALVVPIEEVDHWVDADPALLAHLFEVTRVIGVAQRAAFRCERVGVIIAGYEVPHMHVHVIPTDAMAAAVVRQRRRLGRPRRARRRRRGDPRRAAGDGPHRGDAVEASAPASGTPALGWLRPGR